MPAATLIGLALSQQPSINGATSGVLGSTFAAAAFSLAISALMVAIVLWLSGAPTHAVMFPELPWRLVFGGVIGALFVTGGAMLAPITGAPRHFSPALSPGSCRGPSSRIQLEPLDWKSRSCRFGNWRVSRLHLPEQFLCVGVECAHCHGVFWKGN